MKRTISNADVSRGLALGLVMFGFAGCGLADAPSSLLPMEEEPGLNRLADHLVDDAALRQVVERQNARDTAAVLGMLTSPEASVRARAAFAAASLRAPAAAPALMALLQDADPRVREDAAFALGQLPPESVAQPAEAGGDTPAAVGSDGALLRALTAESDPRVRRALVEALGKVGTEVVAPALVEFVPEPELHAETNLALARMALREVGGDDVWTRLAVDVDHADPDVRARAAYPFARADIVPDWQQHRRSLRVALDGLEYSDRGAYLILTALGKSVDFFSRPRLELWLRHGKDWRARASAAASLAEQKSPRSWELYLEALYDPSIHVRIAVAQAITTEPWGPLGVEAVQRRLMAAPDDHAVNEILLGHLAATGVTEFVMDWVADPDWDDAGWARAAMAMLGASAGQGAVDALVDALDSNEPQVRVLAAAALTERWQASRPIPSARPFFQDLFTELLRSEDDGIMVRAAGVLSDSVLVASGGGETLRTYLAELDDDDSSRRATILRALTDDPDPQSTELIEAGMSDADPAIRRAATQAWNARTGSELPLPPVASTGIARAGLDWDAIRQLGEHPRLVLETERGIVVLEVYPEEAPLTVQQILGLAQEGRYDGVPFHRVVTNFVVQGGDVSRGNGSGGPGFRMRSELTRVPYDRGVLGMARTPAFDSEGSQFFVTHSPQPHLSGLYSAFGRVVEGMDVVDRIGPNDLLLHASVEGADGH